MLTPTIPSDASLVCQIWQDCHTFITKSVFGRSVCVCVCVCPHDNLKTIANFCFLVVTQTGEKSRTSLEHVKVTGQGEGHFSKGSRSFGKVMSYYVAGSEIVLLSKCLVMKLKNSDVKRQATSHWTMRNKETCVRIERILQNNVIYSYHGVQKLPRGQVDRQTDRKTHRQTYRQTDRHYRVKVENQKMLPNILQVRWISLRRIHREFSYE